MNIETAIVGSVSAIAGALTAYFSLKGKQSDNDTKLSAKAFDLMLQQVENLTQQVAELRVENAQINDKLNHAVSLLDSHNIDFSEGKIVEN